MWRVTSRVVLFTSPTLFVPFEVRTSATDDASEESTRCGQETADLAGCAMSIGGVPAQTVSTRLCPSSYRSNAAATQPRSPDGQRALIPKVRYSYSGVRSNAQWSGTLRAFLRLALQCGRAERS